jgi:hypothetical protein
MVQTASLPTLAKKARMGHPRSGLGKNLRRKIRVATRHSNPNCGRFFARGMGSGEGRSSQTPLEPLVLQAQFSPTDRIVVNSDRLALTHFERYGDFATIEAAF